MRMNRGFYTIMAAQFFSSLADNALLIVAISSLRVVHADKWEESLLKVFFVLSYVLLAAFVGAFADAFPKGRVMLITNVIKAVGCALMFTPIHPLAAYAVVGLGAAAYSPAKYGILTELLPAEKLVAANGWIEGLTVLSIILGTVIGSGLVDPKITKIMLNFDFPMIDTGINTPIEAAVSIVCAMYLAAMLFNLRIPDTGVHYKHQEHSPAKLIEDFANCVTMLWKDKLGQITLAVTTLFWGAGATLQFIVLDWAEYALHMPLEHSARLQGVVAIGVAIGAVAAARIMTLRKSLSIMPIGIAMGILVMTLTLVHSIWFAYPLLVAVGILSGFFIVPMNALLQHRGHVLMSAGHSIAVQNFNENLSILTMLVIYTLLIKAHININFIILMFGLFIAYSMLLVMRKHAANQREHDSMALIGEH
jgi:LPLT family lysophospholipid transporter-like MFS transporter